MKKNFLMLLVSAISIITLTSCSSNTVDIDEYNSIEKSDSIDIYNSINLADSIEPYSETSTDIDNTTESKEVTSTEDTEDTSYVDLTTLSSTIVYAEVYNMMTSPESYIGKTVKITGTFSVYQDQTTGKNYYACLITDALACCSQGIEFVLGEDAIYPDDYPEVGSKITVVGEFQTYDEDIYTYINLVDATLEV